MSTSRSQADIESLRNLLLGQLPPSEAERLLAELADDRRMAELANSLADGNDTLLGSLRSHETVTNSQFDQLMSRIHQLLGRGDASKGSSGDTLGLAGNGASSEPSIPERLEYFQIVKVLGQGGMGTVYLADDTRLGRLVALKTLKRELAANPAAKDRFFREARSAAKLHDDHIIPIHYVGESDGIPFLAMPFLEGEPLDSRIKRQMPNDPAALDYHEQVSANSKQLPIPEAIRVAREVAQGLAVAHKQGLIHRDIKPANIWLEAPTGRVKILDFGLARSQSEASNLTASGAIMGTPAYMAPEQARGKQVDARADLFSLGCVLYEMTTGQRPFRGDDTMAVLSSLALDNPEPPHKLNPQCPPALSELTMQLLAKDPAHRPASADVVVGRLAKLAMPVVEVIDRTVITPPANDPWSHLEDSATADVPLATAAEPEASARASQRRKRERRRAPEASARAKQRKHPILPFVAAALLLALIGIGVTFGGTIYRVVTDKGELLIEVEDKDIEVKIVQDGVVVHDKTTKREFTLTSGKGEIEVYEKDGVKLATKKFELTRNGKTTVKVTHQELADARRPKQKIDQKPMVAETKSTPKTITTALDQLDSTQIPPAERFPLQPKELVAVLGTHLGHPWGRVNALAVSPDNKWIATGGADGVIRIWDAETVTEKRVLKGHSMNVSDLAFCPKSNMLASSAVEPDAAVRLWDLDQSEPKGEILVQTDPRAGGFYSVAWSPDGSTLAAGARHHAVVSLWNVAEKRATPRAGIPLDHVPALAFLPDGKHLAVKQLNRLSIWDISDSKPRQTSQVSSSKNGARMFAMSPDGRYFATDEPGVEICVWEWTGQILKPDPAGRIPAKSRDNGSLTFDSNSRLYDVANSVVDTVDWQTGKRKRAIETPYHYYSRIHFLADGWKAFGVGLNGVYSFKRSEKGFEIAQQVASTPSREVYSITVSPTGEFIAARQRTQIQVWKIEATGPRTILTLPKASQEAAVAFSADGTLLAATTSDGTCHVWQRKGDLFEGPV